MDLGGAHGGVNNNVYVTFPNNVGQYCDSGGTGGCAELDFVENNGNCATASTAAAWTWILALWIGHICCSIMLNWTQTV